MWINYQFMAVCPLILNFLHISSQKWLVFANYLSLPNFLPQLAIFFTRIYPSYPWHFPTLHFWLALQVMLSFHVQFQEYFSQKSQDLLWEANFCHSADGVILSFMRYLYEMYSIKKPTHCSRWLWCRYQTCLGALTPPMQVHSRSNQRCDCQREFPFLGEGSAATATVVF